MANRHRPVPCQKTNVTLSAAWRGNRRSRARTGPPAIAPSLAPQARPSLCGSPPAWSPPERGFVLAESALGCSCVRVQNRAQHRFNVSRIRTARHLHLVGSDHDLDGAERRSCAAACSPVPIPRAKQLLPVARCGRGRMPDRCKIRTKCSETAAFLP